MLRRRNDTTNKRLQQGVYSFGQSSVFIHCKVDKNSDDFKSVVQQLVRCEGRYRTSLPSPFSSDARPVDLIVADFRIHTQGDLLQICQDFVDWRDSDKSREDGQPKNPTKRQKLMLKENQDPLVP